MTVALEELQTLVGYEFPGDTYTVEPYRSWLTNDVVLAPQPSDDTAHPMFCYYAALAGMGISIDDLFTLAHATADDGPMFGEAEIELHRPMRAGVTYTIGGEITDVARKQGKSGVFDILTFRLEVTDPEGDLAGVSTNSFIFPRRS